MNDINKPNPQKLCPTCGSRVSETATKCSVCGRNLVQPTAPSKTKTSGVNEPRLPEITLNLPIALGLLILVLAIGAIITFFALRATGSVTPPTPVSTSTVTMTPTTIPTETPTFTPQPTPTLLPPIEYSIKEGDSCLLLAAIYKVSVVSIADINRLPPDCGVLSVGQRLLIPQPTPTPSPIPSSTLSSSQATQSACQTLTYTVQSGDTLAGVAAQYNVDIEALRSWNGLPTDNLFSGANLIIPLCARLPTAGPTPTPTTPPPYPAANLLLPQDGSAFTAANDSVTLQWASVGVLRPNESYNVIIEDLTEGSGRRLVDYVTDTRYIIPVTFRPTDSMPHVIRWNIQPVRQTGTDAEGKPIWQIAGALSTPMVFSWSGLGIASPTPVK